VYGEVAAPIAPLKVADLLTWHVSELNTIHKASKKKGKNIEKEIKEKVFSYQ
jgi:hypothetical protein